MQEITDGATVAQVSYSYNDLDWLTQENKTTGTTTATTDYGYDANGNQTSITTAGGIVRQAWDFEGHLLARGQVNAQGNWVGNHTAYSYDVAGMRLSQNEVDTAGQIAKATSYLWNGDRVAEERDQDGVLQAVYEHGQELGPLRLLRKNGASWQERYFVGDGQDSTRQLLDSVGAIKDSYFYDSFGVGLAGGQGTTENAFRYTGQQLDDSGLYYLRARYYSAGTGRFLSHDPEMGSSDDPISMHRYLYAGDDPANFVDPSGREFSLVGTIANFAVRGILVSAGLGAIGRVAATNSYSPETLLENALEGAVDGGVGFVTLPIQLLKNPGALNAGGAAGFMQLGKILSSPSTTPIQKVAATALVILTIVAVAEGAVGRAKAFTQFASRLSRTAALEEAVAADGEIMRGGLTPKGQGYAKAVIEGGSGNAFEGHGEIRSLAQGLSSETFVMPEGNAIFVPNEGAGIPDGLGLALATDDWDAIANNPQWTEMMKNGRLYVEGETVPNYVLKAPDKLTIASNSMVVEDATELKDLMAQPNQGFRIWAACSKYRFIIRHMYFPDLTPYQYELSKPIISAKNVGWLDKDHPFSTGIVPEGFVEKLIRMSVTAYVNVMRGFHYCEFCSKESIRVEWNGKKSSLGCAEIWFPDARNRMTFYACPELIIHYINDHSYLPPSCFVESVMEFDFESGWDAERVVKELLSDNSHS